MNSLAHELFMSEHYPVTLSKYISLRRDIYVESRITVLRDKALGRARDPRANGAWLSKLTE